MRWPGCLLALTALGGAGCSLAAYECDRDSNCVIQGVAGRCLPSGGTRYCAFAAPDCRSRLRWDDSAEAALAGQCVAPPDLAMRPTDDMTDVDEPDMVVPMGECDPGDPKCERQEVTAPFPLQRDPIGNPAQTDTGLERNGLGDLVIGRPPTGTNALWIANSQDAALRGTVSRFDTRALREVARYFSVTCGSLKTGSSANCDGLRGCCAVDDVYRYRARKAKQPEPGHQSVRVMQNYPSQTAVDLNGDAFVENVSQSGQSSLTKIANSLSGCIDRNRNGRIDTSSDSNGDGVISLDCNQDNVPDDLVGVINSPCNNGLKQEFFGLDDECVLWTANVDEPQSSSKAMALASGGSGVGGADAWVVGQTAGRLFRIDGATGIAAADGAVPVDCRANAMVVDSSGIAWLSPFFQGPLCYFDTRTPSQVGRARAADWGQFNASGVTIDRDQNVWMGGWGQSEAHRYTPVREKGNAALGTGRWVRIQRAGAQAGALSSGRGVAADSRSQSVYYVWLAEALGFMVRLPASDLDKMAPGPGDKTVDGSGFPAYRAAGQAVGTVIDADQNVWTIAQTQVTLTRAKVDAQGTVTVPVINANPMGGNVCPAGDVCSLKGMGSFTDTDSDAGGFALRNFGRGRGAYTWQFSGCKDGGGKPGNTRWYRVNWQGNVPTGASLSVRARSGPTPSPDNTWGSRTIAIAASPLELRGLLAPNDTDDAYLQVELLFTPSPGGLSPSLHSFSVDYRCP